MKTSVAPRSAWSSVSRLTIAACTETSSAETGSSATITSGFAGQRAGDGDPLALAARELVGLARGELGRKLHDVEQPLRLPARRAPAETPQPPQRRGRSRSPTVWLGFSVLSGFWKTIWSCRRSAAGRASIGRRPTSVPSSIAVPAVAVWSPLSTRASVDLPQPDSPTMARVSALRARPGRRR